MYVYIYIGRERNFIAFSLAYYIAYHHYPLLCLAARSWSAGGGGGNHVYAVSTFYGFCFLPDSPFVLRLLASMYVCFFFRLLAFKFVTLFRYPPSRLLFDPVRLLEWKQMSKFKLDWAFQFGTQIKFIHQKSTLRLLLLLLLLLFFRTRSISFSGLLPFSTLFSSPPSKRIAAKLGSGPPGGWSPLERCVFWCLFALGDELMYVCLHIYREREREKFHCL